MSTTEVGAGRDARLVGSLSARVAGREAPAVREGRSSFRYGTICVPLDGSAMGEHALGVGRALAKRLGARLTLVHVHCPGADRAYTGRAEYAWRENAQRCEESQYLWSKVESGEREPSATAILMAGRVPDALLGHLRDEGADLLVMTRHGAGGSGRPWLGSVADRLIRSTPVPVLLVDERADTAGASREEGYRHVLVPLDGSSAAEEVLDPVLALGPVAGKLTLVQVEQPSQGGGGAAPAPGECVPPVRAAQRYLDYVAGQLGERGIGVTAQVLVALRPAEAILALAEQCGADLLAFTLHGEGGRQRRLLGSVADKLVRAAPMTLLVHRPRGPHPERQRRS